jgi:glycosyltransferase involved in cell wall biosynthesis
MISGRRILLVNYEYPPLGGGGGNATMHIAQALAQRGHKPFVLTAAWGDLPAEEEKNGVVIRRIRALRRRADRCSIPEMLAFTAAGMRAAPGLAREWQVEAALVFFTLPCGPIGWWLKRWHKLPYAISLQGGDVPGFDTETLGFYHRLAGGWIRRLWADADAVIANSRGLAALAKAHAPGMSIGVIPAGAGVASLSEHQYPESTESEVRLLFVGRLVKQKGLDVLMRALGKLPLNLNWRLVLAGDGPEWTAIAGDAARLGLSRRVEYRGWLGKEMLATVYSEADLFVLPSRDEGMPNALLEAMAAGLPVVATQVAGTSEAVVNGQTGLMVPPGDADALAGALQALISDPARRQAMGRAGQTRAAARYSWTAVAEAWLEVLMRLPATA